MAFAQFSEDNSVRMAEKWREFERLVSRIERVLGPLGAVVTSPDHVLDSVTERIREVDASIRPGENALPVRVLECRDRAEVEDVTWIEQIITKSRDHGIPTIAVSSSGFSSPAIKKAAHYNIETRVISTLTQEEMVGWVKIAAVEHVVFHTLIEEVFIVVYPNEGDADSISLDPSAEGNAQVFSYVKDGRKFRPSEILDMLTRNGQIQLSEPAENPAILYTAIIKFEKGLFEIPTMVGFRGVSRLKLGFRMNKETILSPLPGEGFSYHGSVRPTVLGIESQTDVLGNQVLVSIHQQPGSNLLSITVTNKDKQ